MKGFGVFTVGLVAGTVVGGVGGLITGIVVTYNIMSNTTLTTTPEGVRFDYSKKGPE